MAILPWRARRQILYFSLFALVIIAIITGIVWYVWPEATCFDNRKNNEEEGIDCGGLCTPCLGEIKDLSVSWVSFLKSRESFYDVAALIENSNLFGAISSLGYTFKLYDANNILIAVRQGKTFINPNEKRIIFESDLSTGPRIPSWANIEFDQQKNWKYIEKEKSFLSIVRKDFVNLPFPRLTAEIKNDSLFDVKDVFVAGVLYDGSGNAIGVSSTKIDSIKPESSQFANFTWPRPFDRGPATIEVFATTNLTGNNE